MDATVGRVGEGQPWLDAVLDLLRENRDRVAAWAASVAPAIGHHPPEATFLAWLDCPGVPDALPSAGTGLRPPSTCHLRGDAGLPLQ